MAEGSAKASRVENQTLSSFLVVSITKADGSASLRSLCGNGRVGATRRKSSSYRG